jgi:hypothetical protein
MPRLIPSLLAATLAACPLVGALAADATVPIRIAQAADTKKKPAATKPAAASPAPAKSTDAPSSKDDLFGTTPDAAAATKAPASKDELFGDSAPASKDELFGAAPAAGSKKSETKQPGLNLKGFVQQETAYTYADPTHWSRAVFRAQVGASGRLGDNAKWKATVRGDVDPVYFNSGYYNDEVKRDQRADFLVGETYVDTSVSGIDLRLGRQNIVWGEMVGLFFADVVSAKDLRSFVLPTFDIIRIPQWAARGEYFSGDSHLELIWIPYNSYDNIGKAGSDFYPMQAPAPAGFQQQFRGELIPDHKLSNSNYGARFSTLKAGWDVSAFYYRSTDASATFQREIVLAPTPTIYWQPRHDRIWQAGGTLSKDLGPAVLKGEVIYTDGRSFNVTRASEATGLVRQDTWDWVLGLDINLPRDARLNVQGFQRIYLEHDPDLYYDRIESGASFLLNVKLVAKWEAEVLVIHSLNRSEYLGRPRIVWKPQQNLRVAFGVDVFGGPITGFLGRYRDRDRVYVETRYDF